MADLCLVPCFRCGAPLDTEFGNVNQPSQGTEFRTFGHYGSTFWDSFAGEELVLNICDECLRSATGRLVRHKRYVTLVVDDTRWGSKVPMVVGRQWISREPVPYFEGPEDRDQVTIEPEEIGVLDRRGEGGYEHIEWIRNWREIKEQLMAEIREREQGGRPCAHERHWAECLTCGAAPLQGLR